MFYYTDKGWRFNLEFDEFFSGYLRKYREPIINQMTRNWNNGFELKLLDWVFHELYFSAKKAAREAAARNAASLTLQIDEQWYFQTSDTNLYISYKIPAPKMLTILWSLRDPFCLYKA